MVDFWIYGTILSSTATAESTLARSPVTETMKAIVKKKAETGLWLEDRPMPRPGINDVLVKVLRTGICGTDVHIYNWDAWAAKTIPVPMVVGHEFVGKIVEVGSNVSDFHVGDIVSGEGHVVCGRIAETAWPVAGIFARTPRGLV